MAEWSESYLSYFRTNSQPECIRIFRCRKWWICEHLCLRSPRHWKYIGHCYHFNTRYICYKFVIFSSVWYL